MTGSDTTTFACTGCGHCCRIPGYVRLTETDVARIAAYMEMDEGAWIAAHTRLTADRQSLSLQEQENGACAFLTEQNTCRIHAVKPEQCVGFPFAWQYENMETICEGWKYEKE